MYIQLGDIFLRQPKIDEVMDIIKKLSHGCTLDCHDCCKFNVYTKGNNVVKIEA